jgi:DNA-directed RNA polymerase specialized sigma24 family protein
VSWLYTTSTRLGVDRLRARRVTVPTDALTEPDGHVPDRVVAARRLLDRVAQRLDPADVALLVWTRLDGLTQPEIAQLTGSSERTVRRRLQELGQIIAQWREDHD